MFNFLFANKLETVDITLIYLFCLSTYLWWNPIVLENTGLQEMFVETIDSRIGKEKQKYFWVKSLRLIQQGD